MARGILILLFVGVLGGVLAQEEECGECDVDVCKKPQNCVAGLVLDDCNCCEICAKAEYELCDHPDLPPLRGASYGKCGENLECRLRKDLPKKEGPEALCYCERNEVLCGSNGQTYDNICQLMAAGVLNKEKIKVESTGPCNSAPVIVSPPSNTKNITGDDIFMVCEAKGFPIPAIEWTWTRVDGKTVFLPSDDNHVSLNMRGGPEKWEITGWLQIMKILKDHEGDYTCIAQNEHGVAQASARVIVADDPRLVKDEN